MAEVGARHLDVVGYVILPDSRLDLATHLSESLAIGIGNLYISGLNWFQF